MKTLKVLIALWITLSFSANLANAQEKENGTVSYYMPLEFNFELWCGDVFIDFIHDIYVEGHVVVHYKNGERIWMKITACETFMFNGVTYEFNGLSEIVEEDIQEVHYNVKGDDGSHYVGSVTIIEGNPTTWTFSKAMCPGN